MKAKSPVDVISISRDAFEKLVNHLAGVKTSMDEILRKHMAARETMGKTKAGLESLASLTNPQ